MWGYHLLFINTGSGNAPHCQPNPLSLHLVPWQGGGGVGAAVTRYRAPDVLWIRRTGVFTPFQILQHVCWWSRCVIECIDSCYSSGIFFLNTISVSITFQLFALLLLILVSLVHIFSITMSPPFLALCFLSPSACSHCFPSFTTIYFPLYSSLASSKSLFRM